MSNEQLLARLGRAVVEYENEVAQHRATIGLLRRLKSGTVKLDEVSVNGDGWEIIPLRVPDEPLTQLEGADGESLTVVV